MSSAEKLAADVVSLIDGAEFDSSLAALIERLRDQAIRMLAMVREPYKVGVIGEYGAGKTLFIASLLGFLDNLPIGDRATTGNVTRFRLRPAAHGSKTTVVGRRVVFLSRSECEDCLAELGQQVRAFTSIAGLDALTQKAVTGDPEALYAWHQSIDSLDPSLDRLVTQLVAVGASARKYGSYLGTERDVSQEEFAELVQISYDGRGRDAGPPADLFWLIRQAELLLDVPTTVLDLPGLVPTDSVAPSTGRSAHTASGDGVSLELWDFPGILNHVSSERDRRLTEVLLRDVDTAVVLLKAANPDSVASDELTRLLTAVNGGATAGVGNLFDSPQAIRFGDAGLDSDDAVLTGLPAIAELLRTAGRLVPGEPSFLYAGLVALNRLDSGPPMGRFDGRVTAQEQLAEHARQVALSLPEGSPLCALLMSAAEDGGRQRALTMLGEQLADHGLRRRVERVERESGRLHVLLDELESALERAPDASGTVAAQVEFQHVMTGLLRVLARLRRALPRILATALTADEREGVPFAQFVEERSAHLIYRWPQWRQMLGSVQGREVREGPEISEELVEPFGESCVTAFGAVRAEALRRWERALLHSAELALAADDSLVARANALFVDHEGPWTLLGRPPAWRGLLTSTPASVLAKAPYQPPDWQRYAAAFPLRRGSRFMWGFPNRYGNEDGDPDVLHRRHPGYVIRLRHELVATGAYLMQSDVAELRIWAGQVIRLFFDRLEELAAEAGPPQTPGVTNEARSSLLEAVRKIRTSSPAEGGADLWSELEL